MVIDLFYFYCVTAFYKTISDKDSNLTLRQLGSLRAASGRESLFANHNAVKTDF